ncbi:ABC1 kinase family protein [Saccharopolyspora shandongensis]|uniref:ABC1 kinase family protein n=1 Tax=Saccharopolyspora shandongensis TaxID=418495 RepID=UPI0033F97EA0
MEAERQDDTSTDRPVPGWRLLIRLVVILSIVGWESARTGPATLFRRIARGRSDARRHGYRGLVRALQNLGPTFVKFGQISSTRRDTMPAELCDAMADLHDAVRPMRRKHAEAALREARLARPALAIAEAEPDAVASGSIACVYRAVLEDGQVVALKLKRPGIDDRMRADLELLRLLVKVAQRMPKMRGMPMADLVGYVSRAILGQLDFEREAANVRHLARCLAGIPAVRVPALHPEPSGPQCLVFDYIPDLDATTPDSLPAQTRRDLAGTVLAAAYRMMFVDGFVHCDLHPGNLYVTPEPQVVILDAGYCVQLPDRVRALLAEFFAQLVAGNGRRCGEIVLESAVDVGPQVDTDGFIAAMTELVAGSAGPGNRFDMAEFGNVVFELQQRFGIYAASDFAFPLMSLLVLEGTARGISPDLDFQQVGAAGRPTDLHNA